MPLTYTLDVAKGGRFRDIAVEAANSVAFYPLSETNGTVAANILQPLLGQRVNDGVWEGTGTTRGVALTTIPGEGLAAQFNGSGRVRVANDGAGYMVPDEASERNLSLAEGDGKVMAVIKTTTNDATLRAIVQKQDTGSGGNGWHLAIQNGQARFFLRVAGSTIFNIAGGSIADGVEHVIYGHYDSDPGNAVATLYVDGVSVATATGVTTEPQATSAAMLIGGWESGGGFVGVIAMVGVMRDGDFNLAAALEAARVWTNLWSHVRLSAEPIQARHGSMAHDPLARLGDPSVLTFALSNHASAALSRPEGYFTPGHVNALEGWKERIPVRWRCSDDGGSTYTTFFQRFIEDIRPEPGQYGSRHVSVTAYSWLAQAVRAQLRPVPVQTAIRSDNALRYLVDQVRRPPAAIDFDTGETTFAYWGDDRSAGTVLADCGRVTLSEGGYLYERRDGTLVFESQAWRYVIDTVPAEWDESILQPGSTAERSMSNVVNVVKVRRHPRRVGSAGTVIASMPARMLIAPGQTVAIELPYQDPAQEAASVGASVVTTPASGTDYSMTANEDGSGSSLTANVAITVDSADKGGASVIVRVTNTSGMDPGWFKTQVRGTPLYAFQPVEEEVRDDASIRQHDPQPLPPLDLVYQSSADEARTFANRLLALYKDPVMFARTAVIVARSTAETDEILAREMGDPVTMTESMTGLAGSVRHFIHGIELTLDANRVLTGMYHLIPGAAADSFEILDEVGHAELGDFAIA